MDQEAQDPMFDALLCEALGGPVPPDLSQQILRALENRSSADKYAEDEPLLEGAPPIHNRSDLIDLLTSQDSTQCELSDSGRHLIVGPLESCRPLDRLAQGPKHDLGKPFEQVENFGVREESVRTSAKRLSGGDAAIGMALTPVSRSATPVDSGGKRFLTHGLFGLGASAAAILLWFVWNPVGWVSSEVAGDPEGNRTGVRAVPDGKQVAVDRLGPQGVGGGRAELDSETADLTEPNRTRVLPDSRELSLPQFGADALDRSELTGQSAFARQDRGSSSAVGPAIRYAAVPEPMEDAEVVDLIDGGLQRYWHEQQTEPMDEVSWDEYRLRISQWIGIDAQLDSGDVVGSLRSNLNISEVRSQLARQLGQRLLGQQGNGRLSGPQQNAFVRFLEPTIEGARPFDETVASLVMARGAIEPGSDQFQPAALWYRALSGPRGVAVTEQFGHAMLDIDLKCGRCHDHPVDARVWQDQYWQLTAIFETGIRWSAASDGELQIEEVQRAGSDEQPVIFFELADGRQKAAIPKPPLRWLGGSNASALGVNSTDAIEQAWQPVSEPLAWLARAVDGSPQVAKAAVNRAWEVVYGMPLVGSAADPSAAPESPALIALQAELADQFRAWDYDFGRLLSWVAAAKPMRLEAPSSFSWPSVESAGADELLLSLRSARVFAAYPKSITKQPLNRMLVLAQVGIRGSDPNVLSGASDGKGTLLGQFQEKNSGQTIQSSSAERQPTAEQLLRAVLDAEVSVGGGALPAGWLGRVWGDDPYRRRVEHLYYLAGYGEPLGWQMDAAQGLREALGDEAAALRRLWWALSHTSP